MAVPTHMRNEVLGLLGYEPPGFRTISQKGYGDPATRSHTPLCATSPILEISPSDRIKIASLGSVRALKHQYLLDQDIRIRVTIVFDKLGRQDSITNGVATSVFTYDPATLALALDTETITYDLNGDNTPDFTRVLDRSRDILGRDIGYTLRSADVSSAPETQATYTYHATTGRLDTIRSGDVSSPQTFTYGYTPNSHLLATITGPSHTVTNQYEPSRDVLDLKENKAGTTLISKYDYTVNAIGQRTEANTSGTAFPATPSWAWDYDSLGQVITADSSVNTSDRAYQYDAMGNRKKSTNSLTLPGSDNYTSNPVNQYTAVNGDNPIHDFDGNLTSGQLPTGSAGLVWDSENRLIAVNVLAQDTIHYAYDAQSRRISRNVGTETTLYVYDAWNVIAEYSGTSLTRTYLWGTDLSGTLQGAGGVGGLLTEKQGSDYFFPTYDGNGNVSEYLAADGSTATHYEYDPFGRTVVSSGPKANDFAYRFSTKPLDQVTGLYYYGYRYFDPVSGRWPSRDPIEEAGGVNLYGFVRNDGIGKCDLLGLEECALSDYMKKRFSRTLSISLFDAEEEFLSIVVAVLGDSITNLTLSLMTARTIIGKVEAKCQICQCTSEGEKATYEWTDDLESEPKSKEVTGANAWSGNTYVAATADTTLYLDAKTIADELQSKMQCSW